MGLEAATKALLDAGMYSSMFKALCSTSAFVGITYDAVQTAYVGYCYGDSTAGQVRSPTALPVKYGPLTKSHREHCTIWGLPISQSSTSTIIARLDQLLCTRQITL